MTGTVSFISEDLQNGSIYPVKKSFGTFVLQELALHKAARRIMKRRETTNMKMNCPEYFLILVMLLWNFKSAKYTEIERLNGKTRTFQTSRWKLISVQVLSYSQGCHSLNR